MTMRLLSRPCPPAHALPASSPLGAAVDDFIAEHARQWAVKTVGQNRAYLNILIEHFGPNRLLGTITKQDANAVKKAQIDWIPLSVGAVRPTQGKTLAVMQVNGGSQSFNAVNQLRILGRWMRLLTIPNQFSTPKAFLEFDDNDRMKPSANCDHMIDVMEELIKFTLLTRGRAEYLVER